MTNFVAPFARRVKRHFRPVRNPPAAAPEPRLDHPGDQSVGVVLVERLPERLVAGDGEVVVDVLRLMWPQFLRAIRICSSGSRVAPVSGLDQTSHSRIGFPWANVLGDRSARRAPGVDLAVQVALPVPVPHLDERLLVAHSDTPVRPSSTAASPAGASGSGCGTCPRLRRRCARPEADDHLGHLFSPSRYFLRTFLTPAGVRFPWVVLFTMMTGARLAASETRDPSRA